MCRTRAFVTFFIVPLLFLAAFGSIAPRHAAAQLPSADLAILRVTGPHQAKPGHLVTIKVLATNLGPAASELDVGFILSASLELVEMDCDLGVSPDTPACEYSNVAPGTRLTTILVAMVLPQDPTGTAFICTNNEGQTEDPNPSNDCTFFTIQVNGG
jgi:hypothetical protein